jgi:hypothetical protein
MKLLPTGQIEALRRLAAQKLPAGEIAQAMAARFGIPPAAVLRKLALLRTPASGGRWKPDQIEALRMMAERKLSPAEIAQALTAEFGIARTCKAVIGKLTRLREERTRAPRPPRPPGAWPKLKLEAGIRYGKYLVPVEEVRSIGRGQRWRFRCDCGRETVKHASAVKCGQVVSCGRCGLGRRRKDEWRRREDEWPPEQVEALRKLAEQKLPAREIAQAMAAQFGVARSRYAVLGKLYRLHEAEVKPPAKLRQQAAAKDTRAV